MTLLHYIPVLNLHCSCDRNKKMQQIVLMATIQQRDKPMQLLQRNCASTGI